MRLELAVERLASSGEGVARAPDGRVVFVAGAAPGDRVRARVVSVRRRFAHAEVEAVLAPGAARVAPFCPAFGECGGCSWQHVDYAAQCEAKRAILRDAFVRLAGLEPPPVDFVASPQTSGHRDRARLRVEGGRVGFRRARSHRVCAVGACPVLAPAAEAALTRLAASPPATDGEVELAVGDDDAVQLEGCGAHGAPVFFSVEGARLRCSAGVFFQSHRALRPVLFARVMEAVGRCERALELHAGAGFFTVGLARRAARVLAVEASAAAVRDLEHNARAAGCANVQVLRGEAEALLAAGGFAAFAPHVVLLDPPRTGLARGAARDLAALRARRIVYVSCDPGTLARDARALVDGGYRLVALTGLDQFPHTPHVEAIAVLETPS